MTEWRGPALDEHASATNGVAGATERVVFAIDFSPASLAAARWVTRHLARPEAALLAHVVPDDVRAPERLRPALLGGLGGLGAALRLSGARPAVHVGSPSAALVTVVAADDARLLVLGRRRDTARQRIGEPNVAERVARRASCAVLVVPEGTDAAIEHVVAGVDGGDGAERVVEAALRLARAREATLTLVHVLPPSYGSYARLRRPHARDAERTAGDDASTDSAHRDAAYARLAWLARDAGPEVACRVEVASGDATREIIALAGSRAGAVVVVGKRGEDGAPVGSLGSVARELLARCPAPVVAVDLA